jgi:hypothetical protein
LEARISRVNTRKEVKWKGTKWVVKWIHEVGTAMRFGFTCFYPNPGLALETGTPGHETQPAISGLEMTKVRFLV